MSETKLLAAINRLNGKQSNDVVSALKIADIARLMNGTNIHCEIRKMAEKQANKRVKNALIELSRHENVITGVDFMFNTGLGL